MHQSDPPRPPKETLPTMYDLPSEDPEEPGLPDEFHIYQPRLLQETFRPPNYPANDVFVALEVRTKWRLYRLVRFNFGWLPEAPDFKSGVLT